MNWILENNISSVKSLAVSKAESGRKYDTYGFGCCGRVSAIFYAMAVEVLEDPTGLNKKEQQQFQNNIIPGSCICEKDTKLEIETAYLELNGQDAVSLNDNTAEIGLATLTLIPYICQSSHSINIEIELAELTITPESAVTSSETPLLRVLTMAKLEVIAETPTYTN